MVAKLAAAAQRRGLGGNLKQQLAPRANDAVAMVTYNAMSSTVSAVETNTYRAEMELPARAVLWEVNENGAPPRDNLPPTSVAWMFDADVTSEAAILLPVPAPIREPTGSLKSPKLPAEDELPYVSGYTDSGVVRPSDRRRWYRSPAWGIGLSGGALFFLAGFQLAVDREQPSA
ncbi:hypothetical protein BRDID11002_26300 [Bradyrhizobium diazoefficiens]